MISTIARRLLVCPFGPHRRATVAGRRRVTARTDQPAALSRDIRHCEERSDEAIHYNRWLGCGLLRVARNDGFPSCAGCDFPESDQSDCPTGKSANSCPAPLAKIFSFTPDPNQFTESHRPVPQRGVAQRHQRGAGCGGRGSARRRTALTRTEKSCGPDASTPASSLRSGAQATVTNKPDHRGEHEGNR
jgi:hypothetical protein